nr:MAG TPA: hypothetical protein [Caudoviricetes sp.]
MRLQFSRRASFILRFNPRTPCGVRPGFVSYAPLKHRFNPRTPCGVRPLKNWMLPITRLFQSTHSLRSATKLAIRLKQA